MRPKKNGIQPAARKINIVRVAEAKKPAPLPSKIAQEREKALGRQRNLSSSSKSTPRSSYSPASEGRNGTGGRKRKTAEREYRVRALSSSPETEGEGDRRKEERGVKRVKVMDRNRRLKSRVAFGGTGAGKGEESSSFAMIHAADIASPARADNREGYREDMVIKLQYPSDSQKERCVMGTMTFGLVWFG